VGLEVLGLGSWVLWYGVFPEDPAGSRLTATGSVLPASTMELVGAPNVGATQFSVTVDPLTGALVKLGAPGGDGTFPTTIIVSTDGALSRVPTRVRIRMK